jgi:hypothetical protein
MTADGAYDGATVYDAVADRHPGAAVIISPRGAITPVNSTVRAAPKLSTDSA